MHAIADPTAIALSIPDVMSRTGLCRQTLYNEINAGRLETFRVGRRRLVSPAALAEWVKTLERTAA
jgi:excisionase family DNA binding protein